jgi:hypothetical protein
MGRRRSYGAPSPPSALGQPHVAAAIEKLKRLQATTIAVMTRWPVARDETIKMLFDPGTLRRAQDAIAIITPASTYKFYPMGGSTWLKVDYGFPVDQPSIFPPISDAVLELQSSAAPLQVYIAEVHRIHLQFEEVKYVLRWLNSHATPGAIRFYWPPAWGLCPDSPAVAEMPHIPSRYLQPQDIHKLAPLLKDTASVYAGAMVLPSDATPRPLGSMRLTFDAELYSPTPDVTFRTDPMEYNI